MSIFHRFSGRRAAIFCAPGAAQAGATTSAASFSLAGVQHGQAWLRLFIERAHYVFEVCVALLRLDRHPALKLGMAAR